MPQFISKPLMFALWAVLATELHGPSAAAQQAAPQDPVCYAYYLKMHDIEFATLEYVTKRDKRLEMKCGAFHRVVQK